MLLEAFCTCWKQINWEVPDYFTSVTSSHKRRFLCWSWERPCLQCFFKVIISGSKVYYLGITQLVVFWRVKLPLFLRKRLLFSRSRDNYGEFTWPYCDTLSLWMLFPVCDVVLSASPSGKMPTVVSPELYRARFCEAMDKYFLMVPDHWTGLGINCWAVWHVRVHFKHRPTGTHSAQSVSSPQAHWTL